MASRLLPVIALTFITALVPAQVAVNDLFDRPNGTNLGPDWAEQAGDGAISNNQLRGNQPWNLGWSMHTTFVSSYAEQVIRADWSQNVVGARLLLIAGADASWGGVSVKIGDNNGDAFADRVWFEAAVNAGSWFNQPTPVFFNLSPVVDAGRVTAARPTTEMQSSPELCSK